MSFINENFQLVVVQTDQFESVYKDCDTINRSNLVFLKFRKVLVPHNFRNLTKVVKWGNSISMFSFLYLHSRGVDLSRI